MHIKTKINVDKICENTGDEEMSETKKEAMEIPCFSDAVKGLKTFRRFIESVENVPEEVFKSLRQLVSYQLDCR